MRNALIPCPLIALALVASGCAAPAVQASPTVVFTPGTFVMSGSARMVDEGEIVVPANRANAASAPITLRFVRFRSTAASPGAPIVFLAGGPGDAATRALRGMPTAYLDELLAIGEVIAFDQRGTGTSEPRDVRCPLTGALASDVPATGRALEQLMAARLAPCLAGAAARGLDVLGLTTAESADDIEALRIALGAPRLSLLAGSYGTHLALSTVRRHPASVDRVALLGVEGPDHTLKLPSRVDAVVARIAAAHRPTLLDDIATLRHRLASSPARVALAGDATIVLGEWDLQRWIGESLDTAREIDAMLSAMPALLAGDYGELGRWAVRFRMPRLINLMNLAMDCASWASADRLAQVEREAASSVLGDAINAPLPALCNVPGLPRLPQSFRSEIRGNVPALLVSGTFDGRTPVENAADVGRGLARARLLTVEGASHDLFANVGAWREVVRFLRQ